jgi:hypothetical protein
MTDPKPKPIAWFHPFKNGGYQITPNKKYPKDQPLYPVREWVGLTSEEIMEITGVTSADSDWNVVIVHKWIRAIEQALKEKNT